ncbi:MAG: aldehyde ferredoxin oxidoreductase [Candidatus Lokiarchaeota archaeon]|nr:aldehyde ferredoxin oxidoreductase [Candidatus Lokiarchaeota archaeon]
MKFIRINMNSLDIQDEEVPEKYSRFGGRMLTTNIIYNEVNPETSPIGSENKLILANGLLAGTRFPNSSRLSIGAKSPLTGGIKESNVGGLAAHRMIQYGIRAIIIEAKPKNGALYIIIISDDGNEIHEMSNLKNKGNYETAEILKDQFGDEITTISIGPAGEMKLKAASIAVMNLSHYPERFAGRGGLGAVMGSKNIKAIVIKRPKDPVKMKIKDKEKFDEVTKPFKKQLKETKKGLSKYGTAGMTEFANTIGGLPTHNYRYGSFEETDKINHYKLHEIILEREGKYGIPCSPYCVIGCSNLFLDKNGNRVCKFEYETIAMNGSNLGIGDLDSIAKINYLCNDLGLDTIEIGASLGVAMEGGLIDFGDAEKVLEILKGLYTNQKETDDNWGRIIANGCVETGKRLDVDRIPAVKGQGMPAYDPRVFKGMGVTFSTSPMGADHTAGPAIAGRGGMDKDKDYGSLSDSKHKIELSHDLQLMTLLCDSMGTCFFIGPNIDTMKIFVKCLNAMYDWDLDLDVFIDLSKTTIKKELDFNKMAGIDDTDCLADFFYKEKSEPSENVFDIDKARTDQLWDYLK